MQYVFIFLTFVQCIVALTDATLYERSEFWPPFCHVNDTITLDGVKISTTTRGVLLRVVGEDGASALVDFGRKGIHLIPTASTDILERARRIEVGSESKRYPNLVELLGSRIIQVQSSEAKRLAHEDYTRIKRFVCIRFPNTNAGWSSVAAWMQSQKDHMISPETIPLLFPQGTAIDDGIIFERISAHGMDHACYLYTFLADSYQHLLWYGLEEGSGGAWVLELDAEGQIVAHDSLYLPGS